MPNPVSPVLSGFAAATGFAENAVNATASILDASVVFTANATLAGGTLTVSGLLAEDRISIRNQGSASGQIGFDGASVTYGGQVMGSASGGAGSSFTVTLNDRASATAVDALIEALTYGNASDAPTASRTLILDVAAADGTSLLHPLASFALASGAALAALGVGTFSAPAFVDLDGDGRLDLVAGEASGALKAWRNTIDGHVALTGAANPFNGIDIGNNSTPTFVDLDGDARLDLVVGESGGSFRTWRNTGTGFTALTGTANPLNGLDPGSNSAPTFFDVDGDGRLDLVSGEAGGGIYLWRNTAGGFVAQTGAANPFAGVSGKLSVPAFFDVDNDGRRDLVVGQEGGGLLVWRNTAGGFVALDSNFSPFKSFDVDKDAAPAFVDTDGDGRLDLVAGSNTGALLVWRNVTPAPASIVVTVTAENDAPAILSGAGGNLSENASGVAYQGSATDADGDRLTWSLSGSDAAVFAIDPATGAVSFRTAPDFETPRDTGADNTYDLVVSVSDGTLSAVRAIAITITDVLEVGDPRNLRGGPGDDRLLGGSAGDVIDGTTGNDTLAGLAGDDTLSGGAGADWLYGGAGMDSMRGDAGDDTYVVEDAGDLVVEADGGGTDTVRARIGYALGPAVENLTLLGRTGLAGTGNALGNLVRGGHGDDTLAGLAGDDRLDGGAGADLLLGGDGADRLAGGAGDDTMDGGAGADSMIGGAGRDVFHVDDPGDVALGGDGLDIVHATVDVTLAVGTELLVLEGGVGLAGTGNALANRIDGTIGDDTLSGRDGDDTLAGGLGDDLLVGGRGADTIIGGPGADLIRYATPAEGGDVILGYRGVQDTIQVSASGFGGGLVAGMDLVATGRYRAVTDLHATTGDGSGQFLYRADLAELWWDGDGTGPAAAVMVCRLGGALGWAGTEIQVLA